ncbi:putative bifunctional diguanylate cyclase/phosphodiesterase [Sphingomonas hengshuiensis]|nr:EAL domain-containing protein [Sphingomonas hengshuiensis]
MPSHSITMPALADLQALLDVIPTAIMIKDARHRLVMVNDSLCAMLGEPRAVLLGREPGDVLPHHQVAAFERSNNHVLATGLDDEVEQELTDIEGRTKRIITRNRRVTIDGQHFLVAVTTDVTEAREAEARNRYLAFHDALTGLPNRTLLNERIEQALLRDRRAPASCALLYVDLDRFKEVNDSHGHAAGDMLIRAFGQRLAAIARASDTVARIGGDEFAILLTDLGDGFDIDQICARILDAASQPFDVQAAQVFVNASIGVAALPDGATDRDELHRMADVALYHAKAAGRGCAHRFSPALDQQARRRATIERCLRTALATGEGLEVHYQPVVDGSGAFVRSMEALVRWTQPELGALAPAEFVPIAEETGLIVPLGEWVLERAARMMAQWPGIPIAVNVSPIQIRTAGIVERVFEIVDSVGLPRDQLHIEITETAIFDGGDGAAEKLRRLRAAGVKIVLDDFGTGYSSLSHLQRLEVDRVKIDQSFVGGLGAGGDSRRIVEAVLCIGRTLGIAVTAEGVESETQRCILRDSGCTEFQGYFFSEPLPEAAMRAYLSQARVSARAA